MMMGHSRKREDYDHYYYDLTVKIQSKIDKKMRAPETKLDGGRLTTGLKSFAVIGGRGPQARASLPVDRAVSASPYLMQCHKRRMSHAR